jgi:hypothetical protein
MSFQQWAPKLSQPSVELWVQDDHVVLGEDGELIASWRVAGAPAVERAWRGSDLTDDAVVGDARTWLARRPRRSHTFLVDHAG